MEARLIRAALLAAVLMVAMGARGRAPNFIVENPDPKLAQQIAQTAEKYRRDLAVEWLGKAMPNWSQPCMMTVHVGPRLGAGGATSFVFDRGEVFGWRMTIQGSRERILDSVLPHEITHMVFASHFRRPVPRWADEGAASSVEHAGERGKHRKMLLQFLKTGRGIAFNRMFAMRQYPRDIMPLYAQGFSVADYLIQRGGKRKFVDFVADGMDDGQWSTAIERHYRIADAGTLQNTWLAWVRQGSPTIQPKQTHPAAAPDDKMLAANERLPRPEPNLIYYIRDKQSRSYAPGSVIPAGGTGPSRDRPRAEPKALPGSGWYAIGSRPSRPPAVAVALPSPPAPVRGHLTRPQPIQHAQPVPQRQPLWQAPAVMPGCFSGG